MFLSVSELEAGIDFITASPSQGKSLILDLVCERLRDDGHFALCITYNSITPFDENAETPDKTAAWFWARVVFMLCSALRCNMTWTEYKFRSFIPFLTYEHVMQFCEQCCPEVFNSSSKRIVVACS